MSYYRLLLSCLLITGFAFRGPGHPAGWTNLFNGKDLTGWDTWLAPRADSNGRRLSDEPIGLNQDPQQVFTVVPQEGQKVIRISGEDVGGMITKGEYGDYHLQVLFKWGSRTWGQKKGKKKDSGLLYHSTGAYGADFGAWMRSHEFQVQQGDCGDYWGCAGATADIPAKKINDTDYVYDPHGTLYTFRADSHIGRHCIKSSDAEAPTGEWNTLDLYCHGDTSVQVVNGHVMMVLYHLSQVVDGQLQPLTRGRIQLQSEGAEVFYKDIRLQSIDRIPVKFLKS